MSSIPKGYKKTELGVIPEDWEIKRMDEVINGCILGGNYANSLIPTSAPLIKMGNLGRGNIVLDKIEYIQNKEKIVIEHKLNHGDILFNTRNTSDLVGKIAMWRNELQEAYFNSNILRIDFNQDIIANFYACYSFNSQESIARMRLLATGTTSVSAIYTKDLLNFKLSIPPLPEQKAIAEVLSDMDALIEAQKELIAKKRDIKQGTMEDLLSGRVRLPGYETKGWKHTDIGDIPDDWEVKELGEISDIISGGTPKTTEKSFWNGTILWCTPTDITRTSGRYIESTEKTITDSGLKNSSAVLLPINSLLLCSRATVGDVRIAKHEITTNQGFKSLICNSSAYYLFIYYLIPSLKPKMLEKSYGSTFLEISKSNLSSIQMQLPSYAEQKAIAQALSDIDDEIETLETELEKLNHMKRGMMQELLTGRTRLV